MAPDYLDPNGGGATETLLHSLTAPQNYTNFSDQYYELLEAVDEGMIIVVDTETDLTAFEGGSHDDVFAFVKGTGDFYVSSGGTFDSMNVSVTSATSPTRKSLTCETHSMKNSSCLPAGRCRGTST